MLVASDVRQILCADCHAIAHGKDPIERHHFAGQANDPRTISVSSNMHRRLTARARKHPYNTKLRSERLRGIADILYEEADEIDLEISQGQ